MIGLVCSRRRHLVRRLRVALIHRELSRVRLCVGLVVALTAALLMGLASPAGAVAGYGDVGEGTWYTDAVQWSTDNGIADIAGPCFGPDTPVSRGETAVWIYNMENQPAAGNSHSFTDVTDASQNDAISWMANTGITTGTSPTTFAPDETLKRAQAAAFLHRLAGEPAAPAHSFVDVVTAWQQGGVSWMAHTGITTGTSPTTFAPEDTLTRAHLVTFLYRYQDEPDVTVNTATPDCDPTTDVTEDSAGAEPAPDEDVDEPENQPSVPVGEPPMPEGEFEDILVSVGGTAWPFLASGLFSDADNDVAELTYATTLSDPAVATVEAVVDRDGRTAIIVTGTAVGSATLTVTATDPSGLSGEQIFNVVVDDSGFTPLPEIKIDNDKIELGDDYITLPGACTPTLINTRVAAFFHELRFTVHSMTWQTRVDSTADWVNIEGTTTTDGRLCPHTAKAAGEYRMVMELSVQPNEHVEPLRGFYTAANTFTATAPPIPPRSVTLAELWNLVGFSQGDHWQLSEFSLLDADQVYVQERKITLPLAGETTLIVVRETPGTLRTIDAIEERVRQHEDFMNVAFPFKTLPAFISYSDYAAGFFIRIYQRHPPVGIVNISPEFEENSSLIAHETAHSYWHSPREVWRQTPTINGVGLYPFVWIFEGAASFLDRLSEGWIPETATIPSQSGCNLFDTIGELDQITFNPDEKSLDGRIHESGCNYTMGFGLFSALYYRLGDDEFRRGFGSLYLKLFNLEHEDQCTGVETGICYVRKAFVEEASPGWYAEAAGEVIDQWYQGDPHPPG